MNNAKNKSLQISINNTSKIVNIGQSNVNGARKACFIKIISSMTAIA